MLEEPPDFFVDHRTPNTPAKPQTNQAASQARCYKQEGGVAVRRDWYGSQLYLLIAPSLHKSLLLLAGKALEHHTCSTCSRYELLLTALCVCVGCWFSIYSLLVSLCVCILSTTPLRRLFLT